MEQKRNGLGEFKPKRKRRTEEQEAAEVAAQYQREKEERKKLADESLANAKLDFIIEPKRGPLVMGRQKKALETSLDYGERIQLSKAVAQKCKEYQRIVNEKYQDAYNSSIMMSDEGTKTKNEILRKIKYQKMKKAKLANFVRIEREKILQQREIEQRKLLMNQSQTSLEDSANGAAAGE